MKAAAPTYVAPIFPSPARRTSTAPCSNRLSSQFRQDAGFHPSHRLRPRKMSQTTSTESPNIAVDSQVEVARRADS